MPSPLQHQQLKLWKFFGCHMPFGYQDKNERSRWRHTCTCVGHVVWNKMQQEFGPKGAQGKSCSYSSTWWKSARMVLLWTPIKLCRSGWRSHPTLMQPRTTTILFLLLVAEHCAMSSTSYFAPHHRWLGRPYLSVDVGAWLPWATAWSGRRFAMTDGSALSV